MDRFTATLVNRKAIDNSIEIESTEAPVTSHMLHLWYSPIYTEGLSTEARFPRDRYQLVKAGLESLRISGDLFLHEPLPLPIEDFYLAHCPNYTNRFINGELTEKEIRRIGLKPWTELIVERTRILTQGTVSATRHALENRSCAGNLGGGTHHAYYDFGSGYCIFNDLAISAQIAKRDYQLKRILILDLDVHQGDGTAAIFADDPTIKTMSLHCGENFPFRKMESDVDIAIDSHTESAEYLDQLEHCFKTEITPFEPELILFQAGVDVLKTDRLGHLNLTPQGVSQRNQQVFDYTKQHRIPLVITMGGGYGEPIETSVAAHIDLFKNATNFS